MQTARKTEITPPEQPELLEAIRVAETEAKLSFLALRCWQDVVRGDHPDDEELSRRLGKIIDEFDEVFGAQQTV